MIVATIGDAFKYAVDVTRGMEYLLSTGNLQSSTGLGLMQVTTSSRKPVTKLINSSYFMSTN